MHTSTEALGVLVLIIIGLVLGGYVYLGLAEFKEIVDQAYTLPRY